jgi:hypothetical protein
MDAGKGKSSDFMLSQALANQVTGIPFDQCLLENRDGTGCEGKQLQGDDLVLAKKPLVS